MKTVLLACSLLLVFSPNVHAIIGGKLAREALYDPIGVLAESGAKGGSCTATLIAEDWIVTAQHCRYGGSEDEPIVYEPSQLEFRIGSDANRPKETFSIKKWVDGPTIRVKNADGEIDEHQLDVAFLQLARPMRSLRPIPASVNKINNGTEGSVFEMVGFGATDATISMKMDGRRRKADMVITASEDNAFIKIFGSKDSFRDYLKRDFPGEEEAIDRHLAHANLLRDYTIHVWNAKGREQKRYEDSCHGDSGGPLLRHRGGVIEIVGVINSGFPGEVYSCAPIGTVIGTFGPEIQKVMRENGIPLKE